MNANTDTDERLRTLAEKALQASMTTGITGLAGWGHYLTEVREVVNHYRGLELGDLIYLRNYTLREIVEELKQRGQDITHQGVNHWLGRYGPTSYITVIAQRGHYRLARIPVTGIVQTRREIAAMTGVGRRIAPSRWEITDDADAEALWERLGS